MDPEQIYQEVLAEEQQKGSASAVAEGRAKAARQRAVHGSPHPKEPRWWPGSQPQFEGGGDGAAPAPAAEAEPEPEAASEEPAAAPPDLGEEAQSDRPEVTAPAPESPPQQTPPPEPAAAPAAAAVAAPAQPAAAATQTELRPEERVAGVTHGTQSGNRLRPEDAVGTDAQFDAQKAMQERRRLIDELVATGVPAVTAEGSGRPKAPMLLLAYIILPLLAIGYLAASDSDEAAGNPAPPPDSGPTTSVAAEGNEFDVDTITLAAAEPASIEFENADAGTDHNIAIYETEAAEESIFEGEIITGPDTATYEFDAPEAGDYYFQCDIHPDMNGNVVSE